MGVYWISVVHESEQCAGGTKKAFILVIDVVVQTKKGLEKWRLLWRDSKRAIIQVLSVVAWTKRDLQLELESLLFSSLFCWSGMSL